MDAEFHISPTSLPHTESDAFQDFDGGVPSYSHQFAGDFYREQDTVTRGVTIPVDLHSSQFKSPFDGYGDCEANLLGGSEFDIGGFGHFPESHVFDPKFAFDQQGHFDAPPFPGPFLGEATFATSVQPAAPAAAAEQEEATFVEGFEPRPAPEDPLFKLQATTITVSCPESSPPLTGAAVGNYMLGFLADEVVASIKKVRNRKFWIKADVFPKKDSFARYAMCTMKIRIYKADGNSYAVEFSRYAGESLVFHSSFKQAFQYLKGQAHLVVKCKDGDITPPPAHLPQLTIPTLPDEPDLPTQVGLMPVLALAAMEDQPSLQAESAALLAEIAEQDASKAADLCTDEVRKAVRYLLNADLLAAAFPTARLLLKLATCPKGDVFFAGEGLLEEILSKVRSGDKLNSLHLASCQLAEVIQVALRLIAMRLSPESAAKLQGDLTVALKEVEHCKTKRFLEQAAETLRTRFGTR